MLKRLDLPRLRNLNPKAKPHRYERKRPGELLHLDTKKLGKIKGIGHRIHGDRSRRKRGIGWEFAHVAVDDHSRVGQVEVLANEKAQTVTGFFRRVVPCFRKRRIRIECVLTDNGSGYRSKRFAAACAELGIRHLFTRPYTPAHQREGGALHPDDAPRMGVRAVLSHLEPADPAATRLARVLQPPPTHTSLGYRPPTSRLRRSQ